MDVEEKTEEIFAAAIEFQDSAQRDAYLASACGRNRELLEKVRRLLQRHDATSFLDTPPFPATTHVTTTPLTESAGQIIGHYKLLEKIGEGGMAVVYMAEQQEPIHRKVALKIIRPGMDTNQVIARFEAERQTLAMMDHPHIARILDAGATDTGRPYFAMDLVPGLPIAEYCDKNRLSIAGRLALFISVCNAVQHAHQKGIIHRDIKPSNIIVTQHDGRPVPKVIDFGIAKATQYRLIERTLFTEHGQLVGTPEYMSPEQARFTGAAVDARTDVYSLGVLLYKLLTGTTPLRAEDLSRAAYDEICRVIRETEPAKPSTRLRSLGATLIDVAEHRGARPEQLCKAVHGDLDWIVTKAMAKEPARRYATAIDLALDIKRYLDDLPIEAGPPSAAYLIRKLLRRNRLWVTTVALVTGALVVGAAATRFIVFPLAPSPPQHASGMVQRHVWDLPFYATPSGMISSDGRIVSYVDWTAGNLGVYQVAQGRYELITDNVEWADTGGWAEESVVSPDGRLVAYSWCKEKTNGLYDLRIADVNGANDRLLYNDPDVFHILPYDWSADGQYVLAHFTRVRAQAEEPVDDPPPRGHLGVVSVVDGMVRIVRPFERPVAPETAAFSPGGRYIVYDLPQRDDVHHRDIFTLDLQTNSEEVLVEHAADDRLMGWSPDGRWVLSATDRTGPVSLWGVRMAGRRPVDEAVPLMTHFDVGSVGFTKAGSFYYSLAVSAYDVCLARLDAAGMAFEGRPKTVSSRFVGRAGNGDWSPDGRFLAYLVDTGSGPADPGRANQLAFSIYSLEDHQERLLTPLQPLRGLRGNHGPRWSPDGQTLLISCTTDEYGPGPYAIDVTTGETRCVKSARLAGAGQAVWAADAAAIFIRGSFRPNHAEVTSTIIRVDLTTGLETELRRGPWGPRGFDLSPDGRWLAFWQDETSLVVMPAAGGQPREVVGLQLRELSGSARFVRWTPDGVHLLFSKGYTELWQVHVQTGRQLFMGLNVKTLIDVAVHPDGRQMAFTVDQPGYELWVMENFLPD